MDINNSNKTIIVLMYHGTPNSSPVSKFSITSKKFISHLDYLKKNQWETYCVKHLEHPINFKSKSIIITFDDGYSDNFEGAFIPLIERNMKASWFITTDFIGKYALWMGPKNEQTKMLNTLQLKQMSEQGMEIGAHTRSHPDLTQLSYDAQFREINDSKQYLESFIEKKIISFAYPFGKYNNESVKAVHESGYRFACSVNSGRHSIQDNPLLIRRITVFSSDTAKMLARKITFSANEVDAAMLGKYYLGRLIARISK